MLTRKFGIGSTPIDIYIIELVGDPFQIFHEIRCSMKLSACIDVCLLCVLKLHVGSNIDYMLYVNSG